MNAPARITALVLALASATALAGPVVLLSPAPGHPESATPRVRAIPIRDTGSLGAGA